MSGLELDMGTVMDIYRHLERGVKLLEHHTGYVNARKYALLLDYQLLLANGIGRDSRQSSMVAVAHILGKRQCEQIINQLVTCFHK